jgi:hypothetical protein
MRDAQYTTTEKSCPEPVSNSKSKKAQYPSFNLWDSEAIKAVFGTTKLEVGEHYDITPVRVRVKSKTESEDRGVSSLELEIVAVGEIEQVDGDEDKDEDA